MVDTRDQFLESPLPSSTECERVVLGAILLDNELAGGAFERLVSRELYSLAHRRIFDAMRTLHGKAKPLDPITIGEELKKTAALEAVGGIPAITNLSYGLPHFSNLTTYVDIIKEKALAREVIATCNATTSDLLTGEEEPGAVLAKLVEIATSLQKSSFSEEAARTGHLITWSDQAEREAQDKYDALDRGDIITVATGYPEIDRILYGGGVWPGDLVVISGVTSGGKTTFALNWADNAGDQDIRSLYFTAEMSTFKTFSRIHSKRAKVPAWKIGPEMTKHFGPGIREKLRLTGHEMSQRPVGYIESVKDMETLSRVTRFAVREYGIQSIFVDYLGLFRPSKRFRGSRYEQVSIVSEMAKELAVECGIAVIMLSQLRRKYSSEKTDGDAEGNLVEPTLDMLKDSGQIENDCDLAVMLWGEKGEEGEREAVRRVFFKIAKARSGPLGRGELLFAPDIYDFISPQVLEEEKKRLLDTRF